MLRHLEGDELRAPTARLRHSSQIPRMGHRRATRTRAAATPTPTCRPAPAAGNDERMPSLRRRRRRHCRCQAIRAARSTAAAAVMPRLALLGTRLARARRGGLTRAHAIHVAGASAEPFGEPSHRTGFHSEDFDAVLNRVESHGRRRRRQPRRGAAARWRRSSRRRCGPPTARRRPTTRASSARSRESDDGARDVLAMLVGAGESSRRRLQSRISKTMGAASASTMRWWGAS